uniref:Secreted protein n=1 Tax=Syphacia muris TaxID=451379 RepID=A0A0N5ATI1_9BILA
MLYKKVLRSNNLSKVVLVAQYRTAKIILTRIALLVMAVATPVAADTASAVAAAEEKSFRAGYILYCLR